jgi:hypothetical protein
VFTEVAFSFGLTTISDVSGVTNEYYKQRSFYKYFEPGEKLTWRSALRSCGHDIKFTHPEDGHAVTTCQTLKCCKAKDTT